jgi:hypothetical protein
MDGSYRGVYTYALTQEDIDNKYVTLPETIISVLEVFLKSDPTATSISNVNNLQVQAYFSDLISGIYTQGNLSNYNMTQSYLSLLNQSLPNSITRVTSYHIYENRLNIPDMVWSNMKVGDLVGLDCYQFKDPDDVGKVFNDYWLKQYTTALVKLQWANNINKFSNINMLGGGTLNAESLLVQAQQEIADLEQKLQNEYSYPIMPFMG